MVAQQPVSLVAAEQSETVCNGFALDWPSFVASPIVDAGDLMPGLNGNPFVAPLNPANRLAWLPGRDGSCGKCGAERVSFRPIRWQGVVTMVCAVCGNDHTTRAGPGMPDVCVVPDVDDGMACGFLRPCPVHQEGGAVSGYGS